MREGFGTNSLDHFVPMIPKTFTSLGDPAHDSPLSASVGDSFLIPADLEGTNGMVPEDQSIPSCFPN